MAARDGDAQAGLTAAPITDALQANLASTAVEAVVPEWQKVILEITEPWFGVHQATEELLQEINHPFPGWLVVEDRREVVEAVHDGRPRAGAGLGGRDRGGEVPQPQPHGLGAGGVG